MRHSLFCTNSILLILFSTLFCRCSYNDFSFKENLYFPYEYPYFLSKNIEVQQIDIKINETESIHTEFLYSSNYSKTTIHFFGFTEEVKETDYFRKWLAINLNTNIISLDNNSVLNHKKRGQNKSHNPLLRNGIMYDAVDIYDFVVDSLKICNRSILSIGSSWGSMSSIHLAKQRKLIALILIDPLYELEMLEKAKRIFPWIMRQGMRMDKSEYINNANILLDSILSIDTPLLVFQCTDHIGYPRSIKDKIKMIDVQKNKSWHDYQITNKNVCLIFAHPLADTLNNFIEKFCTTKK